jgi:hypothetical protein
MAVRLSAVSKLILNKYVVRVRTGFYWLSRGGPLSDSAGSISRPGQGPTATDGSCTGAPLVWQSGLQFAYITHTHCGHRGAHPSNVLHPFHDLLLTSRLRCLAGLKQLQAHFNCVNSFNFSGIMGLEVRVFCHVTPCSLIVVKIYKDPAAASILQAKLKT